MLAGNASRVSVDRFLVFKLLGLMSGLVWLPLVLLGLQLSGLLALLGVVVLWGVCFLAPDVLLDRAHRAPRATRSQRSSPTSSTCS